MFNEHDEQLNCDIVYNLTGWWVQWRDERGHYMGGPFKLYHDAELLALELGFVRWGVWEYEHHTKDVCVPKQTLGKSDGYHHVHA